MTDNTDIMSTGEIPKEPINLFSLFPKIKFDLPFLRPDPSRKLEANGGVEGNKSLTGISDEGETGKESVKPNVVEFPKAQPVVPRPLETEADESNKTSNPVVLWQVYALGGFLILKWVWARWNGRKSQGKSSDDDDDDERGTLDDNNNDQTSDI